jgi:hypothetical protein
MSGHQLIVYDLSFFERLETKRPTALCGFVLAEHLGVYFPKFLSLMPQVQFPNSPSSRTFLTDWQIINQAS